MLSLLNLAIHMELSHLATSAVVEVDFMEGVLAATVGVLLLKAHLQIT